MKVRLVDYDTWRRECDVLMQTHFLEVLAPRGYRFQIDDDFFRQMGETLRNIVAYDNNGLPIGYVQTIVSHNIFDDTTFIAQTSAFTLTQEERKGMAGVKLLRAAEADLAAFCPGAKWRIGIPLDGGRDIGRVVERFLGFKPIERVYQKDLPGGGEA